PWGGGMFSLVLDEHDSRRRRRSTDERARRSARDDFKRWLSARGTRMTLTAMLMAGGKSHRMGKDKATIVFGGGALWQRQLSILKSLDAQTICVSARTRPAWCPSEVETVFDLIPNRGPLSGIAAGLSSLRTSHL